MRLTRRASRSILVPGVNPHDYKERVISLLERLTEDDLEVILPLVERLTTPSAEEMVARWSALPPDDEPLTPEDLEAIRLGREEYERGECTPHEEMRARDAGRREKAA